MSSISIGDMVNKDIISSQTLHVSFENLLRSNVNVLKRVAVKDADRQDTQITFEELNEKSNQLARCLVDQITKNTKLEHNGLPPENSDIICNT